MLDVGAHGCVFCRSVHNLFSFIISDDCAVLVIRSTSKSLCSHADLGRRTWVRVGLPHLSGSRPSRVALLQHPPDGCAFSQGFIPWCNVIEVPLHGCRMFETEYNLLRNRAVLVSPYTDLQTWLVISSYFLPHNHPRSPIGLKLDQQMLHVVCSIRIHRALCGTLEYYNSLCAVPSSCARVHRVSSHLAFERKSLISSRSNMDETMYIKKRSSNRSGTKSHDRSNNKNHDRSGHKEKKKSGHKDKSRDEHRTVKEEPRKHRADVVPKPRTNQSSAVVEAKPVVKEHPTKTHRSVEKEPQQHHPVVEPKPGTSQSSAVVVIKPVAGEQVTVTQPTETQPSVFFSVEDSVDFAQSISSLFGDPFDSNSSGESFLKPVASSSPIAADQNQQGITQYLILNQNTPIFTGKFCLFVNHKPVCLPQSFLISTNLLGTLPIIYNIEAMIEGDNQNVGNQVVIQNEDGQDGGQGQGNGQGEGDRQADRQGNGQGQGNPLEPMEVGQEENGLKIRITHTDYPAVHLTEEQLYLVEEQLEDRLERVDRSVGLKFKSAPKFDRGTMVLDCATPRTAQWALAIVATLQAELPITATRVATRENRVRVGCTVRSRPVTQTQFLRLIEAEYPNFDVSSWQLHSSRILDNNRFMALTLTMAAGSYENLRANFESKLFLGLNGEVKFWVLGARRDEPRAERVFGRRIVGGP